jgi:hypothetical protein
VELEEIMAISRKGGIFLYSLMGAKRKFASAYTGIRAGRSCCEVGLTHKELSSLKI